MRPEIEILIIQPTFIMLYLFFDLVCMPYITKNASWPYKYPVFSVFLRQINLKKDASNNAKNVKERKKN